MKFRNLPDMALGRILSFLDPRSRVMFLAATSEFFREQETDRCPRFFCYFCFLNQWYYSFLVNRTHEDTSLPFLLRNEFVEETIFQGHITQRRYRSTRYRRRNYADPEEESRIAPLYSYLGIG